MKTECKFKTNDRVNVSSDIIPSEMRSGFYQKKVYGQIIESLDDMVARGYRPMDEYSQEWIKRGVNAYRVHIGDQSSLMVVEDRLELIPPPAFGKNSIALRPPRGWHLQRAGHHWVASTDGDGRTRDFEVYQWQPGLHCWALPGRVATGQALLLNDYVYIGPCAMPMFKEEAAPMFEVLDKLRKSKKVDHKDLTEAIDLIKEHISVQV